MTVDELMKPRFKVKADWPTCWHNVGDRYDVPESTTIEEAEEQAKYYRKFPELLEEMPWYEGRMKEELPLYYSYVDWQKKIRYFKAERFVFDFPDGVIRLQEGIEVLMRFDFIKPATEEEYEFSQKHF